MWTLFHHPSVVGSRKVRVALGELGVPVSVELESYWLRRPELEQLNVACEVPILIAPDSPPVVGDHQLYEHTKPDIPEPQRPDPPHRAPR